MVYYNNRRHTTPLTCKCENSEPESVSDEALAVRLLACFLIFNTAALGDCVEGFERDGGFWEGWQKLG